MEISALNIPITPLPPLALLPREEWTLHACGDRHIAVGMFARRIEDGPADGALAVYWIKLGFSAFPNPMFGLDALESAGLLTAYMAYLEKMDGDRRVVLSQADGRV